MPIQANRYAEVSVQPARRRALTTPDSPGSIFGKKPGWVVRWARQLWENDKAGEKTAEQGEYLFLRARSSRLTRVAHSSLA